MKGQLIYISFYGAIVTHEERFIFLFKNYFVNLFQNSYNFNAYHHILGFFAERGRCRLARRPRGLGR